MRVLLICWLLAATSLYSAQAQRAPVISVVSGMVQKVDAKPYAGHTYRLTARVRVDTTNSGGADANLTVFISKKGGKFGSFQALKPPVRSNEWRTYTVTGKVEKDADSLTVYVSCYLNGRFYFDDFALDVAAKPGQWKPIPLVNNSFDEPLAAGNLPRGWREGRPVQGFTWELATDGATGNAYLAVRGQGIVRYGKNARAGHYATANGVKLYYETYGQGEPLLLLHGNGESIVSFSQQIAALATKYQVIAVDTRDHGQSAVTQGRLSYDLFADDMKALLDTLHIPAAHILGWSDGGNTGISMALRYPTRVKSLVTMGANLYADTTAVEAKTLKEVRQMKLLTSVVGPFKKEFRRAHRLTQLLLTYPQLQPAQLKAISAPVLVLAGEKDIIREKHTRLIAASIPHAQVVILPKLTHYAPQENGPLFNQTVLDFLQNIPVEK